MSALKTATLAAVLLLTSASISYADERYPRIQDEIVLKECGECHMAFQPQMLPGRSWVKIMNTLDDHFGEDASLDMATTQHIETHLAENAADAGWFSGKFMRGIKGAMIPLRITETPYWVREHDEEVHPRAWSDPKIKSKANCVACHAEAQRGYYDDD